jgi:hypothetical protein
MAELDLSELMGDPDFADTGIQLIRNTQTLTNGRVTLTPQNYFITASVQPVAANLDILADGQRVASRLSVYTQFQLLAATDTTSGDIVVWNGRNYMTRVVEDFSNFGVGYVEATCELMAMTSLPVPPQVFG